MLTSWTPKPLSLLFPLALLVGGAWSLARDLVALGVSLWALAWLIVGWVIVADIMTRRTDNLDSMARVLEASAKNDVIKLAALGFTPQDIPEIVKVELHDRRDGLHTSKYFDLPVHVSKIVPLASALLNDQPFSEKRWTGAGGLFSTNEFRALRVALRDRGLIKPISNADNRQGFTLTDAGREFFEIVISSPPPLMNTPQNA
jgi:hypothetical protein